MDVGCVIFGMKCRKKQKNMPKITVYKARMTWQFGGTLGCHTSQRIYGRNISNT